MTARWRRSDVGDGLLLGALERDLARIEPGLANHRGERGRLEPRVEQAGRRHVDGHAQGRPTVRPAALVELAGALEDLRHEEHVELDGAVRVDGRLHDRCDRLREHRHVRPEEALVLVQLAAGQLHDRLERDGVERAQAEEVVERLRLDDLGRLGHPDAVRETGHLDRGRERHQVAVRLRQRVIDRDEAVLGRACLAGDRARDELGQLARRARSRSLPSRARGRVNPARATRADARTGCRATTAGARRWGGGDWQRGARDSKGGTIGDGATDRRRRARASCPRPHRAGPVSGVPPLPVPSSAGRGLVSVRPMDDAYVSRSPARISRSRRFSGGASGQAHRGSNAHDGCAAKLKSRMSAQFAGSGPGAAPRSAPLAASTR